MIKHCGTLNGGYHLKQTLIYLEYAKAIRDSSHLIRDLDLRPILETLVRDACAIAGAPDGYIALLDTAGETVQILHGVGLHAPRVGFTLPSGKGSAGLALRIGRTSQVEDYRTWADRVDDHRLDPMTTIVNVPLAVGPVAVGVLAVSWRDEPVSVPPAGVAAVERYAGMCSMALGNAVLHAEARQQQAILEALNRRYSLLFDASPALMSIRTRGTWRYVAVNTAWQRTMGFTADEAVGRTPQELGIVMNQSMDESFRDGRNCDGCPVEIPARTKSGETRHFLTTVSSVELNDEPCVHVASVDITQLKRYEREIQKLDRLNLVGQMAASIGHEVRNPMTAVRGYLQFFQNRRGFGKYREALKIMIGELDRANAIISEFLSLAKDKRIELKPASLDAIILALRPLLAADALRRGHRLDIEIGGVPDILLDESGIRQLILNLTTNALEAMPLGGAVTIRTRCAGGAVLLQVADNGPGIPPDIIDRLGTPFVTTKERGTGLGLAVCHRVAADHGASISVDSSSVGATFTVTFGREGGA